MDDWLLQAQAWWDAHHVDQPAWELTTWQEQKVRHIQLHVAKALGKVVAAYGAGADTVSSIAPLVRVRDEALPDVAIYRSQLRHLFPEVATPLSLPHRRRGAGASDVEPLLRVVLVLSQASARLAAYLEPREHGVPTPPSLIGEAIADLHAGAEALAAVFAVNLRCAHQARLEALLGAPLPASLVEAREA